MSTTPADTLVLSKLENGVKTISLNLPKKKNPIKPETLDLLLMAVKESESDGSKVVVIKGEGGNFCSGAMLNPSMMQNFNVAEYLKEKANPLILAIRESHLPFVAQVEGVCVGLGFSLALACDMVIASQTARFSQIFTRIGLSSDGGGSYFLTKLLGARKAFELIALNKDISAQEALDWQIANSLHSSEEIEDAVRQVAHRLANGPSVAIAQVKANIRTADNGSLAEALEAEADNQAKCFTTFDFMEGVAAFMQKREAKFQGR